MENRKNTRATTLTKRLLSGEISMAELRLGDWMQTVGGTQFWPLDPRPHEFDINHIAHALGNMCRFNGHCRRFYSVAEHCVLVSRACSAANALWGLLHDMSEAYIADVIRPVKPHLSNYKSIES